MLSSTNSSSDVDFFITLIICSAASGNCEGIEHNMAWNAGLNELEIDKPGRNGTEAGAISHQFDVAGL